MSELLKQIRLPMKDGSMAELSLPDLLSMLGKLKFEHIDLRKFNNLPFYDPETVYFVYNPKLFKVYIGDRFVWFPELPKIEGELEGPPSNSVECSLRDNDMGISKNEYIYIPYGGDLKFSMLLNDNIIPFLGKQATPWWSYDYKSKVRSLRPVFVNKHMKPTTMQGGIYNEGAFSEAPYLKDLDLSLFDTTGAVSFGGMFHDCGIENIPDLSLFDFSKVKNMEYMFSYSEISGAIRLKPIDSPLLESLKGFMSGCKIQSFSCERWIAPALTDASGMFSRCTSLESVDLGGLKTQNLTDASDMFSGCTSLKSVNLSGLTQNLTNASGMFSGCTSLQSVGSLSRFESIKYLSSFFENCTALKNVNGLIHGDEVISMSKAFYGCDSLVEIDLSQLRLPKVENLNNMFGFSPSLERILLPTMDSKRSTLNLNDLFYGCSALQSIDLRNFKTIPIEQMNSLFKLCTSLQSVDFSTWDWSTSTNYNKWGSRQFMDCTSLADLKFIRGFAHGFIDLSWSPLTHESALSVINNVGSQTNNYSIKFSTATFDTLTEEEIAIATSKGWRVISA